jgi:hypothetical protein
MWFTTMRSDIVKVSSLISKGLNFIWISENSFYLFSPFNYLTVKTLMKKVSLKRKIITKIGKKEILNEYLNGLFE